MLDGTIDRVFQRNRALARFDGARLEELVADLSGRYADLRRINGQHAVNVCHQEFNGDLGRSNESAAGTGQEEKDWRREFRRGRKTLENEFQKSRAYKSIRELFAGEAGRVLRRLKPVWLMSPLSVADILPLEEQLFDVVIFDEASQIPVEDAIPSLYRARQMIIVGDEMQLPPSSFFAGQANMIFRVSSSADSRPAKSVSDVDLIGQVHQGLFEGAAFGGDVPDRILELLVFRHGINFTSHTSLASSNRMLAIVCLRYRASLS